MRIIGESEIENIALGASLLGTGGGGDPYIGKLMALSAVRKYGPVKLVSLDDVSDEAIVVPTAMMGAPVVMIEKIPNGSEYIKSFNGLGNLLGKEIYGTMPIEAGGINSMIPIAVAAQLGIPLIDVDGMGRAFPELQMVTFHLNGIPASPMVLTDEKGNNLILEAVTNNEAESFARVVTVQMGGAAMISIYSMTGKQLRESGIPDILTYSENLGKILSNARKESRNPVRDILKVTNGYELFKGKISDVERRLEGGFNRGLAVIEGMAEFNGKKMEVAFQNENLIAKVDSEVIAMTPDLICIVDLDTTIPVTTETLKYGRRVLVLGLPCDKRWRTPKGIETVGPRYFGYDVDYIEIGKIVKGGQN
jgi:uncharacterized protein